MNAEIYFPRNGKAFGQTADKSFEETIKKLNGINVNIIYKTEINLTGESIAEALKVSDSGEEKIGIIFIADAMPYDSAQRAQEFFESIGIISKVKRVEAECIDPVQEDLQAMAAAAEKSKKKKKKGGKYEQDIFEEENEEELIDISSSSVNVHIAMKRFYAFTAEYNGKLIVLLPPHEELQTNFNTVLYTAANSVVSPKKKRSFWKRFIPCKGDRPVDVVRKIILILAICTFIVSSYMLINILFIEPAVNDRTTASIRDLLVSTVEGESSETKKKTDGSEGTLSDFSKLLSSNSDTVGWITMPNTVIDYVVVQSPKDAQAVANGEDPYYLYRDFYGNDTKYGSIFLDYRSTLDSKNMLLHGHHMQDGRMFANLMYFQDLEFYKKTPVFTYNTLYEKSQWKIIAIFKTNTLKWQGEIFNYLRGSFSSDYDFLNYIYELRMRSFIDCPVDVNEHDTIVTLSTCCYDFDDFRFVVVARKVRDGESDSVDVSQAKYSDTPLYPDVWYNYRGGVKPIVTSFQDALNRGEIKWYDGDGKWTEKDDEELTKLLNEGKERAEKMMRDSYPKTNYAAEQQTEIDQIIRKYMTLINEASKASEVNDLYTQAVAELSMVKTKKEVDKEAEESKKQEESSKKEVSEQALREAKAEAIAEIQRSIEGNEYRMTQYNEVQQIIAAYTERINNAKGLASVSREKSAAIAALAKIKTNEQLNSEEESSQGQELESERSAALTELQTYVDIDEYDTQQKSVVMRILNDYRIRINAAQSIDEIQGLLGEAEDKLDDVSHTAPSRPSQESSQQSSQESSRESEPEPQSSVEQSSEPESSVEESSKPESSEPESSMEESSQPEISDESSGENTSEPVSEATGA